MVRNEVDELIEHLTIEMLKPKEQAEIKQLITLTPELYREKVENQEFNFAGISKTLEGYKSSTGSPVKEGEIKKIMNRVDRRMLTESPTLMEHRVAYIGGNVVPDKRAYHKHAKENAVKYKQKE